MEYLKEEDNLSNKVLFTGLDTAGKSSIILALQKELSKIALIAPTKGAQRRIFEFLGAEISEWDLGGQKSYRISYLKNPSKYFDNTQIAIFVIDIQNKNRIPEAISYLKDVIKQFYALKIHPPIHILFHKYDPNLPKEIKEKYNSLISELERKIRKETEYEKLSFYKTSIYNLSSIILTISGILLTLYPKKQLIKKTIGEFCNKINCSSLIILDHNVLIIGYYFKNDQSRDLITGIMPNLINLDDSLQKNNYLEDSMNDQIIFQRSKYFILFKKVLLRNDLPPYYLILHKKGQYFFKEDLDPLINILMEIIYK